jgi:hypothetical protein
MGAAPRIRNRMVMGTTGEVHLHLNVAPDQLAAIMRHYTGEE